MVAVTIVIFLVNTSVTSDNIVHGQFAMSKGFLSILNLLLESLVGEVMPGPLWDLASRMGHSFHSFEHPAT